MIDGEEDLTALAFIDAADKETILIYGQPKKGMVLVYPEKVRKKVHAIIEQIKNSQQGNAHKKVKVVKDKTGNKNE